MTSRTYTLNLLGDCMLGRLIDQLLPQHVHNPSEASQASHLRPPLTSDPYTHASPWGNALPLLHSADLTLANLETAATTHDVPWPDKVFNYRMHPANVGVLNLAGIDYVSLANNHTLDFGVEGLRETVRTVRDAWIAYAGAGESREEAWRPAVLKMGGENGSPEYEVHVWSASDHPSDWGSVPLFHLVDYSSATRQRLKALIASSTLPNVTGPRPFKVFSIHWGPNYQWMPSKEIRSLAHFLIDECGIDLIHGHSSHHVQGVEKYGKGVIVYGCGDFVDDYAVVKDFRNDLSALWRVTLGADLGEDGLRLRRLEVHPNKIQKFQAHILEVDEADHRWAVDKVKTLSKQMGTIARSNPGPSGQLTFDF